MAPQMKLYYFNSMGYAEPARLILASANVEYEDIRVERENWPAMKDSIPWGKLPALQLADGHFLCQSIAIIRYLAKKYNLTGENALEAAKCDEYAGAVDDFRQEMIKHFYASDEKTKAELKTKITEESVPKFCTSFAKIVHDNGTGYLIGKKLSSADIVLANMVYQVRRLFEPNLAEKFPEITKFEAFINGHPGIKEWIEKRPVTPY